MNSVWNPSIDDHEFVQVEDMRDPSWVEMLGIGRDISQFAGEGISNADAMEMLLNFAANKSKKHVVNPGFETDDFVVLVVDHAAAWDAHVATCIPAARRKMLAARGYLP